MDKKATETKKEESKTGAKAKEVIKLSIQELEEPELPKYGWINVEVTLHVIHSS